MEMIDITLSNINSLTKFSINDLGYPYILLAFEFGLGLRANLYANAKIVSITKAIAWNILFQLN